MVCHFPQAFAGKSAENKELCSVGQVSWIVGVHKVSPLTNVAFSHIVLTEYKSVYRLFEFPLFQKNRKIFKFG